MEKEVIFCRGKGYLFSGIFWMILCGISCIGATQSDHLVSAIILLVVFILAVHSLYEYFTRKPVIKLTADEIQISDTEKVKWSDIQSIKMKSVLYAYKKYLFLKTEGNEYSFEAYYLHKKPKEVERIIKEFWEQYR